MNNSKKIIGKHSLSSELKIDENGHIDNFPNFEPPNVGNLYEIKFPAFAFWCQKIQPLVYDDSLSYYEVLCKISYKLNEVIEQINNLTQAQKEFIEKVTEIINNLIKDWNDMVNFWNNMMIKWEKMQNEFNDWKNLINKWTEQFNNWKNEFDGWRIEFNNKITEINKLLEELKKFKQDITNEWNNFKNEINNFKNEINNTINQKFEEFKNLLESLKTEINRQFSEINKKIENVQGDITNVTVNVQSVPIIKSTRIQFGGASSIDVKDLIYPQVTIRFFSLIITKGFDSTTKGETGGVVVFTMKANTVDGDDLSYPWLGESLTNSAVSAGSLSIGNSSFPCTIQIPKILNNNSVFDISIPYGYGYNGGETVSGTYYVYQGGTTLLFKTTNGYFERLNRG